MTDKTMAEQMADLERAMRHVQEALLQPVTDIIEDFVRFARRVLIFPNVLIGQVEPNTLRDPATPNVLRKP